MAFSFIEEEKRIQAQAIATKEDIYCRDFLGVFRLCKGWEISDKNMTRGNL